MWSPTGGSDGRIQPMWLRNAGEFIEISDWSVTYHTADGHVTTWYDQSGNGNSATNTTSSQQPLIVDGGTLVEENGKPAIQFDGVDDTLQKDISPDISQPLTLFHVRRYRSNGTYVAVGYDNTTGTGYADINRSGDFQSYYGGGYTGAITDNTDQGLFFSLANNIGSAVGLDGAALDTTNAQGTAGLEHLYIGSVFGAFNAPINTQELIIYASNQSDNRPFIEENINVYYDIYAQDEWDKQSAIKVRRSSDDAVQDIGFKGDDLDTQALLAFVGQENRFKHSDPTSGDYATLLNGSTSANDWGLSSPSFTNKTILDRDLGNALAYPPFDFVETGETYTISAYVNLVDGNSATFGSSLGQQGYFNLRGTAAGSPSDYVVTNISGNIYRISATIVAGSSPGSGFLRWSNANAGEIEVTGFQIVKGSTLTDYVETNADVSGFGFVTTWYDQSGFGNHATNTTSTEQPLIVDAGNVVTENGKAAIKFDGTADALEFTQLESR